MTVRTEHKDIGLAQRYFERVINYVRLACREAQLFHVVAQKRRHACRSLLINDRLIPFAIWCCNGGRMDERTMSVWILHPLQRIIYRLIRA